MMTFKQLSFGLFATLTIQPLAGQFSWNGSDGDFPEPSNWSPQGLPGSGDEIFIPSGIATLPSGNLERAANTTLSGGSLVIANGRFLNNRPASDATFTVGPGSSLIQSGNYFIVGQQAGLGEFIQTGGTVTSNVDRGWGLSDGGNTQGRYLMSGGVLNVNLSGPDFNWEAVVGRAPGGAGDLFEISNGAIANFAGVVGSENRRFYISNRGLVRVKAGGELNATNLRFFVVGRDAAVGTVPRFHLDGGNFNLSDSNAFILSNNGLFQIDSGEVTIANSEIWLGDGGQTGAAATLVQNGGSFTSMDDPVVLSRSATRTGQYFMKGGRLETQDILTGAGVNPKFFFEGGTVILSGDRRAIVGEPFFVTFGEVNASYDGGNNRTSLTVTPPVGVEQSFRFYRFTASQLRTGGSTGTVQLAELELFNGETPVDLTGASISNPGGNNPAGQTATELVDGLVSTKWLDFNNAPIVIDFGNAVAVDRYRLTTAEDAPERDPIRWIIEGSSDGATWELLEQIVDPTILPAGRNVSSITIPLRRDVTLAPLTWTGAMNSNWDTATQNWNEGGARAWSNEAPLLGAIFGSGTPTNITLTEAISADSLSFQAPGYQLNGSFPLALGVFGKVETAEEVTINAPIIGTGGLIKDGLAGLNLNGANTYTGETSILEGTLRYLGASENNGGGPLSMGAESNSRTDLRMESSSTVIFGGTSLIGIGDSAAAVIRQNNGLLFTNGPGLSYLELGGSNPSTVGSYGAFLLEEGEYNSGGNGSISGVRVGRNGFGVFHQTGGLANIARWLAIGGGGEQDGEGLVNLLDGTMNIATGYRVLLGDAAGSFATLNLGSQAGGSASLITLNSVGLAVGQNANTTSILNLNQGTLTLGGPIFRNNLSSTGVVNLNGATISARGNGIDLISNSLAEVNLFNGGITFDTAGSNATVTADLIQPTTAGVYPINGSFEVVDGGAGYLGPPIVKVSTNGSGVGLTAIAEIVDGSVSRVLITSPGYDFKGGDVVTFSFLRGGPITPAPDFVHQLRAADLQENDGGTFVKTGSGLLDLQGQLAFRGNTVVQEGVLALNGVVGPTPILAENSGTVSGSFNASGPVTIKGRFAPGNGVGMAQGSANLTMEPGAVLEIDLGDWTAGEGLGYDTMLFQRIAINATSLNRLLVRINAVGITNFTETSRNLRIAQTAEGVAGLTPENWQIELENFPGAGNWQLAASGGELRLNYDAGAIADYATWLAGFPSLIDTDPHADPDLDGLATIVEYVFDGDPTRGGGTASPSAARDGNGDFLFTYTRRSGSKDTTAQTFQYGSDLVGWTSVVIPRTSEGNVTIAPVPNGSELETVTVRIDASLLLGQKIFGRIRVTVP